MSAESPAGLPPSKLELLRAGQLLAELALVDREEWLLGSGETADLRVEHSTVDAAHARVFLSEGEVFVEDLGSRTGTFVRGRRVEAPVKLVHRDQILLGQHYVVKPLLVRYFDAAAQVLEDFGLIERPAPSMELAPSSTETALVPRRAQPADDTTSLTEGAAAPTMLRRVRWWLGRLWKPVAFVAAGVATVVLLLWMLRPSATVWRAVQTNPTRVTAGDIVTLQGEDIRPQRDLQVQVGGHTAKILERGRGRLRIRVPALLDRPAGNYDVALKVHSGQLETYQWMLQYVVSPTINRVQPSPVEVGSRLSILGSGLADDPQDIHVLLGELEAEVLTITARKVEVRVPVLTRGTPVRVPLEVRVAGAVASPDQPLEVLAREPRPLDFQFAARYAEQRGAWEISTLFGPFGYLPTARPERWPEETDAGDEAGEAYGAGEAAQPRPASTPRREARQPPAEARSPAPVHIERLVGRWKRAQRWARNDLEFRMIPTVPPGGGCRLTGGRSVEAGGLLLGLWHGDSLRDLMAPGRDDLSDEMLCHWFAGIWNRFFQVFGRGEPIATAGPLAQYAAVLNELVERNLELGGDGRPELVEIEEMTAEGREALRRAFLPVPRSLGSVGGRWRVELENVFSDGDAEGRYIMDVDLVQRSGELSGTASSALVRPGMELGFGSRSARGAIELGAPTEVTLQTSLPGPIGAIVLRGVVVEGQLGGRFETGDGKSGTWKAARRP
ncbi:MAG: FHA domain-containing protein [Thermoanaerobaculia bacterium]